MVFDYLNEQTKYVKWCIGFGWPLKLSLEMYTKTQFGGKFHTLGTQNPKMTDLEDAVYLVSFQFTSVTQSCPTLCDPMDCSTPGFPVHQQLPELAQTHVHWVGDAIQPSHPLLSPSPPAFNLSQHWSLFQWVSSLHQVTKVLECQLQHQSFQWIFRTDFL